MINVENFSNGEKGFKTEAAFAYRGKIINVETMQLLHKNITQGSISVLQAKI